MAKGRKQRASEFDRIERIKKLVIIAMFADDEMMELFVLKGGNALDIVHRVSTRASLDIDLSMESDFGPSKLDLFRPRLERSLKNTFQPEGFEILDLTIEERPEAVSPEVAKFWGGYRVEFKLIASEKYARFTNDAAALRRNAVMIGPRGKFQIDISKFEYCHGKQVEDLEGYQIFVYTPLMLVCEKLRAICQQMPEYNAIVQRQRPGTPRARDFLDIHTLVRRFHLDMTTQDNRQLLSNIFKAKRVPLVLLNKIGEFREFHQPDFQAVKATVKPGVQLREFEFYFDFVSKLCQKLHPLGDI
jgi:hypothetical protein